MKKMFIDIEMLEDLIEFRNFEMGNLFLNFLEELVENNQEINVERRMVDSAPIFVETINKSNIDDFINKWRSVFNN